MNAKDIITRRFEKAKFNGYKTEDVDDFLKEISGEYAQLQKEKSELERKLEVLADKIREYRDDEDALKDALLLAQKQGNAIVAESKAAAEKLQKETADAIAKQISEAKAKSEKMIADADDYSKRMTKDSNERADKLVKEARAKADEIKAEMNRQQEIQESILQQTRKEVLDYRNRILTSYKAHIEFIEKLPEKCENDYVKKTAEEVEKRNAEKAKLAAAAKQQAAKTEPAPAPAAEEVPAEEPAAKAEQPEEKVAVAEGVSTKTTENLPFFNSGSEPKMRHSDLQFGKNK